MVTLKYGLMLSFIATTSVSALGNGLALIAPQLRTLAAASGAIPRTFARAYGTKGDEGSGESQKKLCKRYCELFRQEQDLESCLYDVKSKGILNDKDAHEQKLEIESLNKAIATTRADRKSIVAAIDARLSKKQLIMQEIIDMEEADEFIRKARKAAGNNYECLLQSGDEKEQQITLELIIRLNMFQQEIHERLYNLLNDLQK